MPGSLQLDGLPPELLGKIFEYLKTPDILALKLVGLAAGFPSDQADQILHQGQSYFPMMWSQINHICSISVTLLLLDCWTI